VGGKALLLLTGAAAAAGAGTGAAAAVVAAAAGAGGAGELAANGAAVELGWTAAGLLCVTGLTV